MIFSREGHTILHSTYTLGIFIQSPGGLNSFDPITTCIIDFLWNCFCHPFLFWCSVLSKLYQRFCKQRHSYQKCTEVHHLKFWHFCDLFAGFWLNSAQNAKQLFIKWQRKFINCWNYPRHFKIDDTSGYGSKLIFNRWKFYENT